MDQITKKIKVITELLKELHIVSTKRICGEYVFCEKYKSSNTPPENGWQELETNQIFGGIDKHWWVKLNVPELEFKANKEYRLTVTTGREGKWDATNPQCIVYIDGKTVQALDTNHTWVPIDKGGEVYIYLYSGMIDGNFEFNAYVKEIDLQIEALYYDLNVPYLSLLELNEESYDYVKIRDSLNKATMLLDLRNYYSEDFYNSINATSKYLEEEFYGKMCGDSEAFVSCLGHTHIDVAWLWTVAQTREKAQRSFSTVINLLKRYEDYIFMSSQPQLYQFVKEDDPELYEEIKKMVAEGRWEPEGAMWLEADTNLISGESLIRQILYGKQFMQEEFDVDCKILWLPDVFGYSGALPQILKKCGVDKFFTAKMCWNDTDEMPHDVFIWEGIDRSEVLALLIPGYVHELDPKRVKFIWDSFKNKSVSNNPLITYGYGDGGGGPNYEMLENLKRLKRGIPGIPKTSFETASSYMERLQQKFNTTSEELKETPRWKGEMYLEKHRGTYTSIAKNKKNNRKCELLYQEAETLAICDTYLNGTEYPSDKFKKNYINILLNQFHDIIPGSSIKEVYDVTDVEYESILNTGGEITNNALNNIISKISTSGGIFVYNPSPFKASGLIRVDGELYYASDIPSHGWGVISDNPFKSTVCVNDKTLENEMIKVVFDDEYHIISVFDKLENREIVEAGMKINVLEVFEDMPFEYDAWELKNYYKQKRWIVNDVTEVVPLVNGLRIKRKYNKSEFVQDIILNEHSKRIDFITTVDWQEKHQVLKAAFPVNIYCDEASYDIQFGNVKRPTHQNTSWDKSKFEVCAHKWADISEFGYGVSILNDCKYGYSTEGNTMKITLLKAATYPYADADIGKHNFTYSLYPHKGDFRQGGTIQEAYMLNMPLEAVKISSNDGLLADYYSFIKCETDGVVLETIKKAEADNSIVVRLYETYNSKAIAKIETGFDFKEVYVCDMLERVIQSIDFNERTVEIPVDNFEIITLKFVC